MLREKLSEKGVSFFSLLPGLLLGLRSDWLLCLKGRERRERREERGEGRGERREEKEREK